MSKAFELPFYDSKLKEWLTRSRVEPSERNVEALAQLLGKEIQMTVRAVVRYHIMPYFMQARLASRSSTKAKGRTIHPTDVLVAMETHHDGTIPKSLLQNTDMDTVLPKSSFNRAIKDLGMITIQATLKDCDPENLPRLRWSLKALAMVQREVEWYVRTRLDKARAASKRYYNDKTYAHGVKPARSRSKSRSTSKRPKTKRSKRSKEKDALPTSNVYRYLK